MKLELRTILKYTTNLTWIIVLLALIIGQLTSTKKEKQLIEKYCQEYQLEQINANVFTKDSSYFILSSGIGYGGEIKCFINTRNDSIKDILILKQSETTSYFKQCKKLISSYQNQHFSQIPLDAISGATLTSNALTEAVNKSMVLLNPNKEKKHNSIKISKTTPIIILIIILSIIHLFVKNIKAQKILNWIILITTLITIGFWINKPLTLTFLIQLALLNPPSLINNFDIYLLISYSIFSIVFLKKNLYCKHICPFGAFQDCCSLALKPSNKTKFGGLLPNLPLLITGIALIPALLKNAPGLATYEVYSGIFDFKLSLWLYILFVITVIFMIFIKRPWCKLFCPTGAILNTLLKFRIKKWKK